MVFDKEYRTFPPGQIVKQTIPAFGKKGDTHEELPPI
jgi:hypothetical protein